MILWHIALLALIQGISEPLPISSSGHLALAHFFLNDDAGADAAVARQVDIALHMGTFMALVLYFWRDVLALAKGGIVTLQGQFSAPESKMFQYLVVASIPAVIAGYFMAKMDPAFFYNIGRLAWMLIIFGIILGIADRFFSRAKDLTHMSFKQSFLFGLAQILAFIPGVSRSGATMTAGRFLGFDRMSAARFSFQMAMVATFGAGVVGTIDVVQAGDFSLGLQFITAIVLSFFTTYGALLFLMKWLVHHDFKVFVVYRVLLGAAILGLLYSGMIA